MFGFEPAHDSELSLSYQEKAVRAKKTTAL
jgi:hypothetical protein